MSDTSTKGKRGRQKAGDTASLQITLDSNIYALLDAVALTGYLGRNRNEVCSKIITEYLFEQAGRITEKATQNQAIADAVRARGK